MKKSKLWAILLLVSLAACGTNAPVNTPTVINAKVPGASPTSAPPPAAPASTSLAGTAREGETVYKIIANESKVQYEVAETFLNQSNRLNVAVGTSQAVEGSIFGNPKKPSASRLGVITVDISQFKSDSDRRDNMIRQRFLESQRYPTATFTPAKIDGLPDSYTSGETYSFKVIGDLKVHETTRPVTFEVSAKLAGTDLTGSATTTLLMSDFGVGPISLAGILNTEDKVKVTFNFVARPE
jgi:polyisoprenoid-binding protein YceI